MGDGTFFDDSTFFTYTYATEGDYEVLMTVRDSADPSCFNDYQMTVTAYPELFATFSFNQNLSRLDFTIDELSGGSMGAKDISWDFGDGEYDYGQWNMHWRFG